MGILDTINSPQDVKALSKEQLPQLCSEIREYMVDCCSRNPGHLASSLGAVELIVGLHYIYDAPKDKLIFDVGHQAYAHKILTGRREEFKNIRVGNGISGFPKIEESIYDCFGVGHSSTSISAALGFAEASRLKGSKEKVVALIGDGALTGGLAFEGMNNAGASKSDLLIILNDNNQSIDKNTGSIHNHLLNLTTNPAYNRVKDKIWNAMGETKARSFFQRWARSLKSWFVKKSGGDIFEALGFRYFGPIDGNDIFQVTETLDKIKSLNGPRILHCITKKGKGYSPAEADPTIWHAPGKFNPKTGERISTTYVCDRFQDVFGEVLCDLAEKDDRVIGITPAMASGCGMTEFSKKYPERFFDVGIEEEHAVTFAAGLAANGMRPFCNIYSAFSQRAYDQIIHDVALQHLPVVFCFDRAGLVGEDGATHQGAFDMAAYRSIPGMSIAAPKDELELKRLMYTALKKEDGPIIIRYPRGIGHGVEWRDADYEQLPLGVGEKLIDGDEIAILAIGHICKEAVAAAEQFNVEAGKKVAVYNMRFLKPVDEYLLEEVGQKFKKILTVEDGAIKGGLFSEVCEYMAKNGYKPNIQGVGIPDRFIEHARQSDQRTMCGLNKDRILDNLKILSQKD